MMAGNKMSKAATLAIVLQFVALCSINIASSGANVITNDHGNFGMINNAPLRVVGVCTETSDCNDLKFEWPAKSNQSAMIVTSKSGKRFSMISLNDLGSRKIHNSTHNITVDLNQAKQPIMGWGGAFTDATCYHITRVGEPLKEKLISSYFGPDGLGYEFGRVPIGGSDFSSRPYSYDDTNDNSVDYDLDNWSLATEDVEYKIPVIERAMQLTDSKLKLFGSPWSPPAWMKTNHNITGGKLIASDEIYQSYANYLVRFFDAYQKVGIDFWGATVQNEPAWASLPKQMFNSLDFNGEEQALFISKFYGPALRASNRTKENFKLMVGDDNLGFDNFHVPEILRDEEAARYVSGLAFHWYLSGTVVSYNDLNVLYDQVKDDIEFVMMTEACTGSSPIDRGPYLGNWTRAYLYANDIIEDLARHTNAWIDWNMVLDLKGGPNWVSNFVDSPIIVDADKKLFYKQPMYYALAHFTKLFKPGCRVLQPAGSSAKDGLSYIGCHIKETNHLVLNLLSSSDQPQIVNLNVVGTSKTRQIELEPESLTSIVLKL